mmetsp:Transcript_40475/g.84700  ORF Transcript_40475/g.84700 Transcript_40475/m.84700 type:complete len:86 (+) Transcript_40475:1469-1726(+)
MHAYAVPAICHGPNDFISLFVHANSMPSFLPIEYHCFQSAHCVGLPCHCSNLTKIDTHDIKMLTSSMVTMKHFQADHKQLQLPPW